MTIYTQGSFDTFHSGHIALLKKCRTLAGENGRVIVSLLTDESYTAYRGYEPVMPFKERRAVLAACRYVDQVLPGDNRLTRQELEEIEPDIVAVGSDWAKKDIYQQYGVDQAWFDQQGIILLYFPYTDGVSSSQIKKRLCTNQQ